MPAITVHRYASATVQPSTNGTQFVDNQLVINGPVTIPLPESLYGVTQDYVLFDYAGGTFPQGQTALDNYVTPYIDDSALQYSEVAAVIDEPLKSRVLLKMQSKGDNGAQFVDQDLDISGPTTFVMSKALVKTAGIYTLFDVAGTITPGSLANLLVQPPSGRALDPAQSPNPYIDGNRIKVKLL